jgi:hypothetical protein
MDDDGARDEDGDRGDDARAGEREHVKKSTGCLCTSSCTSKADALWRQPGGTGCLFHGACRRDDDDRPGAGIRES